MSIQPHGRPASAANPKFAHTEQSGGGPLRILLHFGDLEVSPMHPSHRLTLAPTDWLLLVILSILWGGSFFFAKIAVATIALGLAAIDGRPLAWAYRVGTGFSPR
jgi:hypothetical protein